MAEMLELLLWMSDDDGEVETAVERWLQSEDRLRIEVALQVEDWFPFRHREEMEAVFSVIKVRWPEFRARCDEIVRKRASLPQGQATPRSADLEQRLEHLAELLKKVTG